jgi:phospholipid N-methyltransferase
MKTLGSKGSEYANIRDEMLNVGFDVRESSVLDMFAGDGTFRSVDFLSYAREITAWEKSNEKALKLKKVFPHATVVRGDSILLAHRVNIHEIYYDIVIVDSPVKLFSNGYCEHFDVLENAHSLLSERGLILINIVPTILFYNEEHLRRRQEFYGEDVEGKSIDFFIDFYKDLFSRWGSTLIHLHAEDHVFNSPVVGKVVNYWLAGFLLEKTNG